MNKEFVFITGASSGMGEATAILLAQDYNLILNGRNLDRLSLVGKQCEEAGANVYLFPYDLEECDTLADTLKKFLLKNQLRVNAFAHFAGMTEVLSMAQTRLAIGQKVMNVNYFSATEIISTLLKKRFNGDSLHNIILVSSLAAYGCVAYQPHYSASKGALLSLTKALAYELAPNIRVNLIVPGGFDTRILKTALKDQDKVFVPPSILPPGTVQEVAKVAKFLLSPDSSYITGQELFVDGGERFNLPQKKIKSTS